MKIEISDIDNIRYLENIRLYLKKESLQNKLENTPKVFADYKDLNSLFNDFFKYFEVKEYQVNDNFIIIDFIDKTPLNYKQEILHKEMDRIVGIFMNTFNSVMFHLCK